MSNASFVRRAPEIAEEILAKTANLPKDLQTFTRGLFEKEAAQVGDPLKMPARMTIADLQKVASANKVDLPKVGAAPSDEYGSVAEGLRKMAEHHANETRDDILAAAVAIMEKTGAGWAQTIAAPFRAAGRAAAGAGKGIASIIPGTKGYRARVIEKAKWEKQLAGIRAETPSRPEWTAAQEAAKTHAEGVAKQKARTETLKTVSGVAPAVALGVGVPTGAMALRPEGKKEIKAFRAIA